MNPFVHGGKVIGIVGEFIEDMNGYWHKLQPDIHEADHHQKS